MAQGHKTGFYLDQRDNRRHFAQAVRHFGCAEVLNCYSYTGGFTLAALAGGAQQCHQRRFVGAGAGAGAAHVQLNGFDAARHDTLDADVNATLRARWSRAGASTPSCSTRPSSRPPRRRPSARRAPTRTSTAWR